MAEVDLGSVQGPRGPKGDTGATGPQGPKGDTGDKGDKGDPATNTTYTLTQDASDGHKFALVGSDGSSKSITIPDNNTTYTSKAAASGGTEVSLVTTGEKAAWNAKTSNTGTITKVQANGTDVASSGVANIPAATTAKYGCTQLSSATNSTSEALAATPKAVKDAYDLANSKTSNTGTVTKVSTGVGLTGGDITGTGTVKAKLKTETAHTLDSAAQTNTASRQYAVGVDKSGYLSVNVPWKNTTYTPATAAPLMDGTGTVGTSANYAREDHRHPTDTSRAAAADLTALSNYIKNHCLEF